MTVPLSPGSPRRDAARRFGAELQKAMHRRGVGKRPVAEAGQVGLSALANWKSGNNLPTLASAIRIAEALEWPKLAEMVRDARTGTCVIDGRKFLNDGGSPKLYCSPDCREEGDRRRAGIRGGKREAIQILQGEFLRIGAVRKQSIGKVLTLLEADKAIERIDRLAVHRDAVEAMCRQCEPLGYCRTVDCPLRAISPLPLLLSDRQADVVVKPAGPNSPASITLRTESTRRAWARRTPEERRAQTMPMRAAKDAMSPEAKAEMGRRVGAANAIHNRERVAARQKAGARA